MTDDQQRTSGDMPDNEGRIKFGGGMQHGGGMVEPDEFTEDNDTGGRMGDPAGYLGSDRVVGADQMSEAASQANRGASTPGDQSLPNDALGDPSIPREATGR